MYNDVILQDFAGPVEVFSKAQNLTKGKYKIFTVGLTTAEIYTENNLLKILPDYHLDNFPKADYFVIPGGGMPIINSLMKDEKLKEFIQKWNAGRLGRVILSVCTGSYLLADAGILDGKKATTHYFLADDFKERYLK